jgi:hypothetical protein
VGPRECDATEPEREKASSIVARPPLDICISFLLNDKRVTATMIPLSAFFSLHPFANIWSAVLKLHAIRFATREKVQCVAIDYANVFQV